LPLGRLSETGVVVTVFKKDSSISARAIFLERRGLEDAFFTMSSSSFLRDDSSFSSSSFLRTDFFFLSS